MDDTYIKNNRSTRKFITISDTSLWDIIDEISELNPKYNKSFNAVINDALKYGLPMLLNTLKGDVTLKNDSLLPEENFEIADMVVKGMEKFYSVNNIITENQFYAQLVQLLQEVVLNVIISKSLISSLYNAKELELKKLPVNIEKFSNGQYENTPDYLESYELRELAKIQKKNLS